MSNSKLYVGNLSFKTTEDELRSALHSPDVLYASVLGFYLGCFLGALEGVLAGNLRSLARGALLGECEH